MTGGRGGNTNAPRACLAASCARRSRCASSRRPSPPDPGSTQEGLRCAMPPAQHSPRRTTSSHPDAANLRPWPGERQSRGPHSFMDPHHGAAEPTGGLCGHPKNTLLGKEEETLEASALSRSLRGISTDQCGKRRPRPTGTIRGSTAGEDRCQNLKRLLALGWVAGELADSREKRFTCAHVDRVHAPGARLGLEGGPVGDHRRHLVVMVARLREKEHIVEATLFPHPIPDHRPRQGVAGSLGPCPAMPCSPRPREGVRPAQDRVAPAARPSRRPGPAAPGRAGPRFRPRSAPPPCPLPGAPP